MKPIGTRPGIPAPLGVTDPVALKVFVAMREAIEYLTLEVETLKAQVAATPRSLGTRPVWRDPDGCEND